ncbi:hypothetical protein JAAARDRAFT_245691 [Jaapia argillacea MUCL 33604]|uniref:Uncharacterized protein n=1 Tax=Jaapia argillacea MUCL 33604 TaxID=933084 RepID=A0A067QFR5_9AGAM|nr:hypothetical protein JAAARDRAFT_245691 [Jaapia argillacea MUCL 33604]
MSTFDAIFTSLQQFPDLFSSLSFNHAVKFVHHASILKPDIIKLTQRSDSVPESASDVSASSIPDQLPSNIRTLLSESVNICEEHVDGCWVAFKQAAWEFDSKEFEQDFKAFHIPPRPLPSPFIPKQEHNREIVDLTPAMTEHGKRKLVGEMPRLSAALCPKTDRAQKLHFDPNIPNGQIAHLLPEEQEEAMKAKQWRHAIQKVFLNKEPKIAPEKLIEMDKVFTLVESFEPEHELMTCYLQVSHPLLLLYSLLHLPFTIP